MYAVGKTKYALFLQSEKYMHVIINCISSQAGQAEHDIMDHTNGVKQTAEPLKLTR